MTNKTPPVPAAVLDRPNPGSKAPGLWRLKATSSYRVLEQRMVFDGAAVDTAADIAAEPAPELAPETASVAQQSAADVAMAPSADGTGGSEPAEDAAGTNLIESLAAGAAAASGSGQHEATVIVFIDEAVTDFATIANAVPEGAEVHYISTDRDGLEQIAEVLAGRTGVDAVHIVSHGEAGKLRLGSGELTSDSMSGEHADELAVIKAALSQDADILIYGCDVAAGDAGDAFVNGLAAATGADVAASTDTTGGSEAGGDWVLERSTGTIEAATISADDYAGVLVENNSGT